MREIVAFLWTSPVKSLQVLSEEVIADQVVLEYTILAALSRIQMRQWLALDVSEE